MTWLTLKAWILEHRRPIGACMVCFSLGWFAHRPSCPPAQASATATQAQSGKVEVRYIQRPPKPGQPCPEIEVVSTMEGSQGQTATAEAKAPPPLLPSLAVPLGIGYLETPFISAGLRYDRATLEALYGLNGAWGGKLSWEAVRF